MRRTSKGVPVGSLQLPWSQRILRHQSNHAQAASGAAGAASSGAATTTGDIIFTGFCDADWACTAGSGFTARSTLISSRTWWRRPGQYAATGTANSGWSMRPTLALKPNSAPSAVRKNPSAAVSLSATSLTFGATVDKDTAQTITVTNTRVSLPSSITLRLTGADPTDEPPLAARRWRRELAASLSWLAAVRGHSRFRAALCHGLPR